MLNPPPMEIHRVAPLTVVPSGVRQSRRPMKEAARRGTVNLRYISTGRREATSMTTSPREAKMNCLLRKYIGSSNRLRLKIMEEL